MTLAEMATCCLFDVLIVKIVNYTGSSRHRRIKLVLIIKQDGYIIRQIYTANSCSVDMIAPLSSHPVSKTLVLGKLVTFWRAQKAASENLKTYLLSIYFFVDTRTASMKKINLTWKQCIASDLRLALYQFPRRWSLKHELKVLIPTRFIWHLNPGRVGFGRCEAPFLTLWEERVHTCPKLAQASPDGTTTLLDDKTIICFH